jgi:hypothetical protein
MGSARWPLGLLDWLGCSGVEDLASGQQGCCGALQGRETVGLLLPQLLSSSCRLAAWTHHMPCSCHTARAPPPPPARPPQLRALIADKELARRVGAAARQEVEVFGWQAATRKIREQQYLRAIRLGRTRQRCAAPWGGTAGAAGLSVLCALLAAVMGPGLLLGRLCELPAAAWARLARAAVAPRPSSGLPDLVA